MNLIIPTNIQEQLIQALKRAKHREIGGILMGEHLGDDWFRLAEVTVQEKGGSTSHFVRNDNDHLPALTSFFERHGDCTRFNYLGEWHSHPCHPLFPSSQDQRTMCSIVNEPELTNRPNFAVLLILRLVSSQQLKGRGFAFTSSPNGFHEISVSIETNVEHI